MDRLDRWICISLHPKTQARFCADFENGDCKAGRKCKKGMHVCNVKMGPGRICGRDDHGSCNHPTR